MRQLGSALGLMLYEVTKAEYKEIEDVNPKRGYVISDGGNYIVNQGQVVAQREANRIRNNIVKVNFEDIFEPVTPAVEEVEPVIEEKPVEPIVEVSHEASYKVVSMGTPEEGKPHTARRIRKRVSE